MPHWKPHEPTERAAHAAAFYPAHQFPQRVAYSATKSPSFRTAFRFSFLAAFWSANDSAQR
jgi:hypothetical protein